MLLFAIISIVPLIFKAQLYYFNATLGIKPKVKNSIRQTDISLNFDKNFTTKIFYKFRSELSKIMTHLGKPTLNDTIIK